MRYYNCYKIHLHSIVGSVLKCKQWKVYIYLSNFVIYVHLCLSDRLFPWSYKYLWLVDCWPLFLIYWFVVMTILKQYGQINIKLVYIISSTIDFYDFICGLFNLYPHLCIINLRYVILQADHFKCILYYNNFSW